MKAVSWRKRNTVINWKIRITDIGLVIYFVIGHKKLLRLLIVVVASIKNEEVYTKLETTYVLSFHQHCHEPNYSTKFWISKC